MTDLTTQLSKFLAAMVGSWDGTVTGTGTLTFGASGGSAHELLSATHTDATAGTVARGDLITGQGASATWTRLAKGTVGKILQSDGTDLGWAAPTGTGVPVLATSPTLVTPVLGVAAGTSVVLTPSAAIGLTLTGATETASVPLISGTQTWNNSGVTFAASKVNVTSTASAVFSLLQDWQVAGASLAGVVKDGSVYAATGVWKTAATSFNGSNYMGISWNTGNSFTFYPGSGTACLLSSVAACSVTSSATLGWSNGAASATQDLILTRSAAAVLQMGADLNGAAIAQTLQACNGITGTDKAGADFTIQSGKGTGDGTISSVFFKTPALAGSGTTAQTLTTRLTINSSGIKATGYLSSDGTAGATAGPFTTITAITVKNGLVTALTGS